MVPVWGFLVPPASGVRLCSIWSSRFLQTHCIPSVKWIICLMGGTCCVTVLRKSIPADVQLSPSPQLLPLCASHPHGLESIFGNREGGFWCILSILDLKKSIWCFMDCFALEIVWSESISKLDSKTTFQPVVTIKNNFKSYIFIIFYIYKNIYLLYYILLYIISYIYFNNAFLWLTG